MTEPRTDLTSERANELLSYDPLTGNLTRKKALSNSMKVGDRAGSINGAKDYIRLYVDSKRFLAHRVIWLMMTGEWPRYEIDHINNNKQDNRWENLRQLTPLENGQNKKLTMNTVSGLRGVSFSKCTGKWMAQIAVGGKMKYLGIYLTKEEAHAVYLREKVKEHPFGVFEIPDYVHAIWAKHQQSADV